MGNIVILDENSSNRIAAGEVIEKPASVVKELVENSIDAGARTISVELKNGGISLIKVTDNGSGINEDDVEIAFERHATSKIRSADDLESIATLGFRGEALASIAAVSSVEVRTRVAKNTHGTYLKIQGGQVKDIAQTGCPVGTTFVIRDLFYNTPARYKFLKKDTTEAGYVSDVMSRIALTRPDISFRLVSAGSTVLHTPGNNDLLSAVYCVYGKDIAGSLVGFDESDKHFRISGYTGRPEIARSNRNQQTFFINGRYVKSRIISSAVESAYKTFLMKGKFPFIVLNISVNPMLVDVNVHPTKMEVKFADEQEVYRSVYHAVYNSLINKPSIKSIQLEQKTADPFRAADAHEPVQYEQETIKDPPVFVREYKAPAAPSKYPVQSSEGDMTSAAAPESMMDDNSDKAAGAGQIHEGMVIPGSEYMNRSEQMTEQTPVTEPEEVREQSQVTGTEQMNEISQIDNETLDKALYIGQAFSTYIILQLGNELILMDQHAAHERIMYEGLLKKYRESEPLAQLLLTPAVIELSPAELKIVETEKDFLDSIGFNCEYFGNNSIILRSVPFGSDEQQVKKLFLEVLDNCSTVGKGDYRKAAEEALYTVACKAAVKANKKLDASEVRSIIEQLASIENPYTCPHGRPTVIRLSRHELEKMFKRIV